MSETQPEAGGSSGLEWWYFAHFAYGAIQLVSASMRGYYGKRRFFDTLSSIISRRDLTSTSAPTGIKPTQDEVISVKLFRTAGPVDYTEGSFRTMAGMDIGAPGLDECRYTRVDTRLCQSRNRLETMAGRRPGTQEDRTIDCQISENGSVG